MTQFSRRLAATSTAVVATAVVGSLGTRVRSAWYVGLRKPTWQPPGAVFGPAWTTLYGLIAVAAAQALNRESDADQRARFRTAFAVNLVLNAGWNWLFFAAERPRASLGEIVVLEASTLDLLRRAAKTGALPASLLAPYAAWVGFATALNAAIVLKNPGSR